MGIGSSRRHQKNERQLSNVLDSKIPGNTATQQDKHADTSDRETSGHVADALPVEHTVPDGIALISESGPKPMMTKKDFESGVYKMDHENRGMAIIINNKTFMPHLNLPDRPGTDVDGDALYATFHSMGFDVKFHNNKTVAEMMSILYKASNDHQFHSKSDCFMCTILTHGHEQDVLYGTDGPVDFKTILSLFKGKACPGLLGKPKMFFIQACQGKLYDEGVALDVADSNVVPSREISTKKIPIEADILRAHSSAPGYVAWREEKKGSWFIQTLTEVLNKNWKDMELLKILTRVNHIVACKMTDTEMTQMPMFTSTLTKDVLFTPKNSY